MTFYIAKASWGNDSVALVAWLTERVRIPGSIFNAREHHARTLLGKPPCFFDSANCTRSERVVCTSHPRLSAQAEHLATRAGHSALCHPVTLWTTIRRASGKVDELDPERAAVVCVGVRREESARRASYPEHVSADESTHMRDTWAPLVRMLTPERDTILRRHGFEPLPYRSRECHPCMNANKSDLRSLSPERIAEVEAAEVVVGRTFFPPSHVGGAKGIREAVRWAHTDRGRFDTAQISLCDEGWCGL